MTSVSTMIFSYKDINNNHHITIIQIAKTPKIRLTRLRDLKGKNIIYIFLIFHHLMKNLKILLSFCFTAHFLYFFSLKLKVFTNKHTVFSHSKSLSCLGLFLTLSYTLYSFID